MLNRQELETMGTLINRVDIKGSEAMAVAILMQKIGQEIQKQPKKDEKKSDIIVPKDVK